MTRTLENDAELVDAAVSWLGARLPETWAFERTQRSSVGEGSGARQQPDMAVDLRAPNGTLATLAIEPKRSLEPRDVDRLAFRSARTLRAIAGDAPVLLVAPWLSPRTQQRLSEERINFLDLTGNAQIRLDAPALYIEAAGAKRNPQPAARGRAQLRGRKAARLIRVLADVRPPYGVRELAAASELTPGYVSRLLDTLDREALVDRSPRGAVESADVAGLLRRWAESYDVLRTNDAEEFVAPNGAAQALRAVGSRSEDEGVVVTGSFAAVRLAPVAGPSLLLAYCENRGPLADWLGLLAGGEAANVVLLRPFDRVATARTTAAGGVRYAAPSQIAVDCLTGTGRMPAEGEAVLSWMAQNESAWRLNSLDDLPRPSISLNG